MTAITLKPVKDFWTGKPEYVPFSDADESLVKHLMGYGQTHAVSMDLTPSEVTDILTPLATAHGWTITILEPTP